MDLKYNETGVLQLNIISSKFDLINKFINELISKNYKCENGDKSIKIMDIGCSLGKNSVIQMSNIIGNLRENLKIYKLIETFHADQEINNFSELFLCVNNSDESYLKKWDNVFPYAIGKNFMKLLTPENSIDIIFSYFTLHWCERNTSILKNNDLFFTSRLHNPLIEEFSKQRLNVILSQRYKELKCGGLLICNLISTDSNEILQRFQDSFKNFKQIFRDMANENILTHDEVDDMNIPILVYNSKTIENEINKTGFQILEMSQQIFDWGIDEIIDDNERAVQFVDSVLSFCGPNMKISIKGGENHSNNIYNQFVQRFYKNFKNNPSLYRFKVDTIFLILKK